MEQLIACTFSFIQTTQKSSSTKVAIVNTAPTKCWETMFKTCACYVYGYNFPAEKWYVRGPQHHSKHAITYSASSLLRVLKETSLTFSLSPVATAESMLLSERWIPLGVLPTTRLSYAQVLRIENDSATNILSLTFGLVSACKCNLVLFRITLNSILK